MTSNYCTPQPQDNEYDYIFEAGNKPLARFRE